MKLGSTLSRIGVSRFVMVALVGAAYLATRTDNSISPEVLAASHTLKLIPSEIALPIDDKYKTKTLRKVNSGLRQIDGWISSVGSGVALADIQGTGKPKDICLTEPRTDSVWVLPALATDNSYKPFELPSIKGKQPLETTAPMGCLPLDANEDGKNDLLVYYWGRTPVIYIRNSDPFGHKGFTAVSIIEEDQTWFTNAAVSTDIDGDGHLDLVFGNYFANDAAVLDQKRSTSKIMQHSMSRAENGGTNRLLLWQNSTSSTVNLRDASDVFTPEMANGWTLALGARDLTGDSLPELYVANDFGPDRLLYNESEPGSPRFRIVEGKRTFLTPRSTVLGRDSFKGMGVDFGDVSANGLASIAVSNISAPQALIESHFFFEPTMEAEGWKIGYAPYRNNSGPRGITTTNWSWDIKFADLLNSGKLSLVQAIGFQRGETNRWPELHELAMGNDELLSDAHVWPRFSSGDDLSGHDHDRLFIQDNDGRFHDVWNETALRDWTGAVSRGIAIADVRGDGRLSFAISRQWAPSIFVLNESSDVGLAFSLDLRVKGFVAGTRPAVGAEVRIKLPDGTITSNWVDGGSGHSGKRAPEIHLGLGHRNDWKGRRFDVEIKWRDAKGQHTRTLQLVPGRYSIDLDSGDLLASNAF